MYRVPNLENLLDLRRKVLKEEKGLLDFNALTAEQRLAIILHRDCKWEHDGKECQWYKENQWNEPYHRHFLGEARKMLLATSYEEIIDTMKSTGRDPFVNELDKELKRQYDAYREFISVQMEFWKDRRDIAILDEGFNIDDYDSIDHDYFDDLTKLEDFFNRSSDPMSIISRLSDKAKMYYYQYITFKAMEKNLNTISSAT